MDTKSTNRKNGNLLSWLCFVLSVSILFTVASAALQTFFSGGNAVAQAKQSLQTALDNNPQETAAFREDVSQIAYAALMDLADDELRGSFSKTYPNLKWETANILMFAQEDSRDTLSNTGSTDPESARNARLLQSYLSGAPEGYNYMLLFDGDSLVIERDGVRVYDTDAMIDSDGYRTYFSQLADKDGDFWESYPKLSDLSLVMVISPNLHTDRDSAVLSDATDELFSLQVLWFGGAAALVLALLMFLFYLFSRGRKAEVDQQLAQISGEIWFEIKLVFLGWAAWFCAQPFLEKGSIKETLFPLLLLFWTLLFLLNDLRYNPHVYLHNSYRSTKNWYLSHQMKKRFQQRMTSGFGLFAVTEGILFWIFRAVPSSLAAWITAAAAAAVLLLYARYFIRMLMDFARLTDRISEIKSGAETPPLALHAESAFAPAAEDLNSIQSGISHAVEDQVRAERMKVELITNVSHDIKTPLTSIINYIGLLRQEKDLPEYVQDYIEILAGKADRLKKMVQDIFEVSKASTGNIELHPEPLILQKLIQQTLADMEETITTSGLALRLDLPQEPVYILTDGNRMYRVFQNLFRNALQYSLEGSRVFIQLTVQEGTAFTQVKNTSRFALDNLPDVTERFVRGDESRSTDGSGLGLSIAKSFTEACGGSFSVTTDADLFCATVSFPVIPAPQPGEPAVSPQDADQNDSEEFLRSAVPDFASEQAVQTEKPFENLQEKEKQNPSEPENFI
ncbi:sensor histidine kinase [Faecalispora anaeroviscerum]|uniref:sensor histidine kinase n=1 Tax=Faecalispora anaeroviscerum TaxID=2991836 RepID=UPI0024BA2510|nr:HAMP domain-containing sensor histidine kinase [Faecalispora anaeroviscerum]